MIIYLLISPSGKYYIGKTSKTIDERFKIHQRESRCGKDTQLARALRKYNQPELWTKKILYECNKEQSNLLEKFFIDFYQSYDNKFGYNMTLGGDGIDSETASKLKTRWYETENGKLKKKELSKIFKENNPGKGVWMGRKHTNETKKKIADSHRGKTWDEERKEKRSKLVKKMWEDGIYDNRPPQTDEHIKKRAEGRRGSKQSEKQKEIAAKVNSKIWEVTSPSGEVMVIENLRKFAIENGLDQGNLSRGKHKGWKAKKIE